MSLQFKPYLAAAPLHVAGQSIAAVKQQYNLDEVIKLGSNENPLGPSPMAVAAIQEAAQGLNRYPPMGDDDLKIALTESLGQGLQADHFVTAHSACDLLDMIAISMLREGDECIICRPTFPVYQLTAERVGAKMVFADLDPDDFSYSMETILEAITPQTRLIYLCNPNNPTGTIITSTQFEYLMQNLPDEILVISDEVYYQFATATLPNTWEHVLNGKNIIIVHSFSKVYGLAALRLGYGISTPEIATYIARQRQPFHLGQMSLAGGIAALRDHQHLEKTIALTITGREWLTAKLRQLEQQVWPSQTNFVLFKPTYPAAEVAEYLLQRGIIVRVLKPFYLPDYLRVSVGLPAENQKFITLLAEMTQQGGPT